MRVAHILFSFRTGGIENLLVDLANNWTAEDDFLICIINNEIDETLINRLHMRKNMHVARLNRKRNTSKILYLLKLNHILMRYKPDAVHCHSSNAFLFVSLLKVLHPSWPFFLTIHDTHIYNKLPKPVIFSQQLLLKKIFAISNAVYKEIANSGFPKKKISIIYNGIDSKKFLKHIDNNNDKKNLNILCIARLVPKKKGQDILIRAVALLNRRGFKVRCSLVGAAPADHQEYRDELEKLVHELQVEENVFFLGNRSDVPQLLAHADLFVLPSRYEGFGIAIVEAMMAGVPVIASDIDGPKEIIKNGENGLLFHSGDVEALVSAILQVMSGELKNETEKIQKEAILKYGIENMANSLRKEYFSI